MSDLLMLLLTLDQARDRLGLNDANLRKAIDRGALDVEETHAGARISEASIVKFERERQEKKSRGMQELTALSNALGLTE